LIPFFTPPYFPKFSEALFAVAVILSENNEKLVAKSCTFRYNFKEPLIYAVQAKDFLQK
jgi:hypothetical protein